VRRKREAQTRSSRRGPIRRVRARRRLRAARRSTEAIKGYGVPAQVCPKGCEHVELARRDVLAQTRWTGRADVHVAYTFESTNCPLCGSRLVRRCARCEGAVVAPVAPRCQHCGLPHPWAPERRSGAEGTAVRRWRGADVNDPATRVYSLGDSEIWVIEGDLVRMDVEAIVSNDDVEGRMWTEVAYSIRRAAGEEIAYLARDGAPRRMGTAWVTEAGALPIKGIIHVAAMNRRGEQSLKLVQTCLSEALARAVEERFRSVGVAAIGSGPNAIRLEKWLRAFAQTVVSHLPAKPGNGATQPLAILLVLYEPADFDAAVRTLERAICDAWIAHGAPAEAVLSWLCGSRWRRFWRLFVRWSLYVGREVLGLPITAWKAVWR